MLAVYFLETLFDCTVVNMKTILDASSLKLFLMGLAFPFWLCFWSVFLSLYPCYTCSQTFAKIYGWILCTHWVLWLFWYLVWVFPKISLYLCCSLIGIIGSNYDMYYSSQVSVSLLDYFKENLKHIFITSIFWLISDWRTQKYWSWKCTIQGRFCKKQW